MFQQAVEDGNYVGRFFSVGGRPTLAGNPSADYVALQQWLAAAGDGVGVQTQKIAEQGIAAMAEPNRFQAGEQAALLFVEQRIEEQDSGFEFVRRDFKGGRVNGQGNRLGTATRQGLIPAIGRRDGSIQILAIDFGSAEALSLHQMA